MKRSLKAATTSSDQGDVFRRQLANASRVGLLDHLTARIPRFVEAERWGSLQASLEWPQYLHEPELSRLEATAKCRGGLREGCR